jgi:hypothetical protein
MKKLVITFETDGNNTIEAFGFTGGECLKATKSLEEALGKVGSRTMKSEAGGGKVVAKAVASR